MKQAIMIEVGDRIIRSNQYSEVVDKKNCKSSLGKIDEKYLNKIEELKNFLEDEK